MWVQPFDDDALRPAMWSDRLGYGMWKEQKKHLLRGVPEFVFTLRQSEQLALHFLLFLPLEQECLNIYIFGTIGMFCSRAIEILR